LKTLRFVPRIVLAISVCGLLQACSGDPPRVPEDRPCLDTPLIQTEGGEVCGIRTQGGFPDGPQQTVYAYLGIPFADTTAGENRWQPPQPVTQWQEPLLAQSYGKSCPQPGMPEDEISEDCLTVNVWTPDVTGKRPVMVFIYGGAYLIGTSDSREYNGVYLAGGGDLVVVTLNYRINTLGFLAGIDGLDGNYGILDQQRAMQWVQQNIARFGGDPDRVTLFGESAGAMSVGVHLTMPSSQGLFRAAIMESNPYGVPYKDRIMAEKLGNSLKKLVGCEGQGLECMRQVSWQDLVKIRVDYDEIICAGLRVLLEWAPIVDGTLIPEQPNQKGIDKPVILGTNLNEGNLFVYGLLGKDQTMTLEEYLGGVAFLFGDHAPQILLDYEPLQLQSGNAAAFSQIATDYIFTCATEYVATRGSEAVYAYQDTHVPSFPCWQGVVECEPANGKVCHGEELPFVFGDDQAFPFTPGEKSFSTDVMRYWTEFAVTGKNPNASGNPGWSFFLPEEPHYQILNEEISHKSSLGAKCDSLWNEVGYERTDLFNGCFQSWP
jgi:carboxylesterase type B